MLQITLHFLRLNDVIRMTLCFDHNPSYTREYYMLRNHTFGRLRDDLAAQYVS